MRASNGPSTVLCAVPKNVLLEVHFSHFFNIYSEVVTHVEAADMVNHEKITHGRLEIYIKTHIYVVRQLQCALISLFFRRVSLSSSAQLLFSHSSACCIYNASVFKSAAHVK